MGRTPKYKQQVIDLLSEVQIALSADEVLEQMHEAPNRVTVYRILDRLESEGTAHRIVGMNGKNYYSLCETSCNDEGHVHNHAHFQCRQCNELICLEIEPPLPANVKHKVEEQQVLLIGVCESCNA